MRAPTASLILAASLCLGGAEALAFGLPGRGRSVRPPPTSTTSSSSSATPPQLNDLQVKQKQKAGMTNLRFQASTNYATQPTPALSSLEDDHDSKELTKFFFDPAIRDRVLRGGDDEKKASSGANRLQVLTNPDVSLYNLWKVEASHAPNFVPPQVGDPILRVTTHGIHFPGLQIRTRATVGCKKVLMDKSPQLQITLITDELQATGPDPLVWVFRSLTGANQKNKKSAADRRTHSTNTLAMEATPDGRAIFSSVAHLAIDVSFPSFLLKILPVSKTMAEQQGSEAIRKVVERDIGPSLEAVRQLYIDSCHISKETNAEE